MTEEKVHKKYKCLSLFSCEALLFFFALTLCHVLFISKNFYFLRPFYVLKKIPVHTKLLLLLLNVGRKMKLSKKARAFFGKKTKNDEFYHKC